MKYFLLVVIFFCIGYLIPVLAPFFQVILSVVVVAAALLVAWAYLHLRGLAE